MLRLAGLRLALAAMLLQALLPSGWMPNTTGTPGAPFVICTIDGPVRLATGIHAPLRHQSPVQNDTHNTDQCPFAAAPHFATLAPGAVHVFSGVEFLTLKQQLEPQRVAVARGRAPQSPRAPPIFV